MQFQVQGQNYYLKFDPGAGRWYLLKPTLDGFTGMAVWMTAHVRRRLT